MYKALRVLLACSYLLLTQNYLLAQKNDLKPGKITPADFVVNSPVVDSNANAVVLWDVGSSDFEGNSNGFFTLVFKIHERILLRNKNAFDEATVKVPLYAAGGPDLEERFEDFEATTYNLENGQVVETKLDKTAIFKEKYNRYSNNLKFTLPNLKEGSIIEYTYTVKSPFQHNNIRSWSFQGKYPALWSQYKVTIPPFFNYVTLKQGYLPYFMDSVKREFKNYSIVDPGDGNTSSQVYHLSGDAVVAWWAMKNVPAFKEEPYVSSPNNHLARIKFQLQSISYSSDHVTQVLKSWFNTANDLMKDPDFGLSLSDPNGWLDDDIKKITHGATDALEKAKRTFEYVRDNFVCTDHDEHYLSNPLRKTWQSKKGNVADINLLLTAMLINEGFEAHPVILSTRDNGKAMESQAVLSQYNYVISRVEIDSVFYLLDASVNRLGFGKLSPNCYNGSGRIIDKMPYLIPLSTDSLVENKTTNVFMINDTATNTFSGSYTSNLGYFESLTARDELAKTKQEDYLKNIAKTYPAEVEISNAEIDSLRQYDMPLAIRYDMKLQFNEDIVYFSPMFNESWKNNPFASAERLYPVEMSYKIHENYILNMEVPKGYKVDEIPKSTRVKLNDTEGMFEYIVSNSNGFIQLYCKLYLQKANYTPDDYETLRNFFAYVVKKEAEQIVFKKIK
ncbi:hypothetical protein F5148DRAFT_1290467 [Russula earlei]|uniref:Uncharacterized protein n=1 Tax=Russula earlei TaxID=71964 RepID=A0ACC0TWJ1_9AGAM|nr:hypothetical protein F5148DRAFT_1290467 [Russula earlei]